MLKRTEKVLAAIKNGCRTYKEIMNEAKIKHEDKVFESLADLNMSRNIRAVPYETVGWVIDEEGKC
jgi:hypothetical protein